MTNERNTPFGRDKEWENIHLSEIQFISEKFDVAQEIVTDAIRACGYDREKIEKYLRERTGRGRGELGENNNAPK